MQRREIVFPVWVLAQQARGHWPTWGLTMALALGGPGPLGTGLALGGCGEGEWVGFHRGPPPSHLGGWGWGWEGSRLAWFGRVQRLNVAHAWSGSGLSACVLLPVLLRHLLGFGPGVWFRMRCRTVTPQGNGHLGFSIHQGQAAMDLI